MKIKLSIIAAALICATMLTSCKENEALPSVLTDTEEELSVILKESEDMGSDYIDSFVFFGESTTYHLKSRAVLSGGKDTAQVLGNKSGTAMLDETTATMAVIYPETGELVSIHEAIRRKQPKYMLLTFGLNGAVQKIKQGKEIFKANYKRLIDAVLDASPKTKIILGSCYPVAENMDMSNYSVSLSELNSYIATINSWTLELAKEEGLRYLNVNEILTDENKNLKKEYQSGDGHHLTRQAYIQIVDYIRTHGYK